MRLINRDVVLTTYIFNYDMAANLGYYDTQGTISDVENELTSGYGEYSPDTKDAEFRYNVLLQDKKKEDFRITTEVLRYNTETHIAN
ncbi:OstA-like protein, partial [uncultured Duncaniella sp.]|uniref:OstA-like protein n=1 Tax=uncultured Duncaniella sp. TaxID=2768039 RepID=UPI0025AE1BA9